MFLYLDSEYGNRRTSLDAVESVHAPFGGNLCVEIYAHLDVSKYYNGIQLGSIIMEQAIAHHIPSSIKVLNIPELVHTIASHCSSGDTARLSQVCQQTFNALIPTIWKHLCGVNILLRLITQLFDIRARLGS